jgi:hypothetical protein
MLGAPVAGAHAAYTCRVQGLSFVLSDRDFDLMRAGPSEAGMTRRQFVALGRHSDQRNRICLTRLLVRELEAGKIRCADMTGRFGDYGSGYMSNAETDRLAAFQKTCP